MFNTSPNKISLHSHLSTLTKLFKKYGEIDADISLQILYVATTYSKRGRQHHFQLNFKLPTKPCQALSI